MSTETTERTVSRRDFLKGAITVAGLTLVGGAGALLSGCQSQQTSNQTQPAVTWPFPYKKLDPAKVAERAYNKYKEAGCGYGAVDAIIGTLADQYGEPYKFFPTKACILMASGFTQNSLCGAIGGAAIAVGLLCDDKTGKEIIGDLIRWYKNNPFPAYQPAKLGLPTSVANSDLCRDSINGWLKVAGVTLDDPKRKERCGGLTADVAAKTVELLNAKLIK